MSKFKHTPGPWKVTGGWNENGKGGFPSVIFHGTEEQYQKSYGRNGVTINSSHDQQVESLMANAKLIAAAPELLQALCQIQFAVKFGAVKGLFQDEIECMNNAINKALGESN